jgi:hypothetical protein
MIPAINGGSKPMNDSINLDWPDYETREDRIRKENLSGRVTSDHMQEVMRTIFKCARQTKSKKEDQWEAAKTFRQYMDDFSLTIFNMGREAGKEERLDMEAQGILERVKVAMATLSEGQDFAHQAIKAMYGQAFLEIAEQGNQRRQNYHRSYDQAMEAAQRQYVSALKIETGSNENETEYAPNRSE